MLKEIQKSLNTSIITAVMCLALGIAFIVIPEKSFTILSNIFGVILIVYGVFDIISSFRANYILSSSIATTGVLALVAGLAIFLNREVLQSIITFVLGVIFVSTGLTKIRLSIVLNKNNEKWLIPFVISVVTVVIGVLMVIKPINENYIAYFIGIMMIVYAISDLVDTIYLKTKIKKTEDFFENLLPIKK